MIKKVADIFRINSINNNKTSVCVFSSVIKKVYNCTDAVKTSLIIFPVEFWNREK